MIIYYSVRKAVAIDMRNERKISPQILQITPIFGIIGSAKLVESVAAFWLLPRYLRE
jgi:hypothetical protein